VAISGGALEKWAGDRSRAGIFLRALLFRLAQGTLAAPLRVTIFLLACSVPWGDSSYGGLGCAGAAAASPMARVISIQRYASEESARIVVQLSAPVRFRHGRAPQTGAPSSTLHVDLEGAVHSGAKSHDMEGLVDRVRLLQVGSALRVAIDVSEPARHGVFYLPSPFRVVIDVSRREPPRATPHDERRVSRIALDPGHGGSDPGAMGPAGAREKDLVLDIAHRTAPLLARELGVSTLLTRDVDARVPLEERVARANAFGADLFVSIHCNADRSGRARGVMTFVLDGSRDQRMIHLAERENGSRVSNGEELGHFVRQFQDSATRERSGTFARLLQRATLASLSTTYPDALDAGVHGAGFYVLAGARMPAVLFEASFVSNTIEESRLSTERYRQKLADGIVNAVRAYREGYDVSTAVPAAAHGE
jgi:N-acetylmuramoyl-L-alanine amidase